MPTDLEMELIQMTGGVIPADDLMLLAKHSQIVDGTVLISPPGMLLMAKYSPLGSDVAIPIVEQIIAEAEKRLNLPPGSTIKETNG